MATSETTPVGPSLSMRVVIFGIRKRFPSVNHLNCSQAAELSKSQDVIYLYYGIDLRLYSVSIAVVLCVPQNMSSMEKLLDTRAKEEYEVSHIPGAIWVDPDASDVTGVVNQLSTTIPVVCYCSVGYRSSLVAQRLYRHYKEQEKTCPPLHNLEGGLFQWANEGRPLAISNIVHPYSSAWGKLLDSKLRAQM